MAALPPTRSSLTGSLDMAAVFPSAGLEWPWQQLIGKMVRRISKKSEESGYKMSENFWGAHLLACGPLAAVIVVASCGEQRAGRWQRISGH